MAPFFPAPVRIATARQGRDWWEGGNHLPSPEGSPPPKAANACLPSCDYAASIRFSWTVRKLRGGHAVIQLITPKESLIPSIHPHHSLPYTHQALRPVAIPPSPPPLPLHEGEDDHFQLRLAAGHRFPASFGEKRLQSLPPSPPPPSIPPPPIHSPYRSDCPPSSLIALDADSSQLSRTTLFWPELTGLCADQRRSLLKRDVCGCR